jgi:hypothetical protein
MAPCRPNVSFVPLADVKRHEMDRPFTPEMAQRTALTRGAKALLELHRLLQPAILELFIDHPVQSGANPIEVQPFRERLFLLRYPWCFP